jgi:hypothetical protein
MERDCAVIFKLFPESARERIKAVFEKETAERQIQAEAEAKAKYEEE